ncbi:hypothetical protein H0X48_02445 [Candidatus Dependentiae bacterium]|nr:hypothetical protein [Candidatus Dependentiae bacterium]
MNIKYYVSIIVVHVAMVNALDENLKQKIVQSNSEQLSSMSNSFKRAAFGDSASIELEPQGYTNFKAFQDASFTLVESDVALGKAPRVYIQYITDLKRMRDLIADNTAKKLTTTYGNKSKNTINLLLLKSKIQNERALSDKIANVALATIFNKSGLPDSWKQRVAKDIKQIFPQWDKFFASWQQFKKLTKGALTDKEFDYFLKLQSIQNERDAFTLVDRLEKIKYRLEEQNRSSIFNRGNADRNKVIQDINEIKLRTLKSYPPHGLISSLEIAQYNATKDTSSVTMYLAAGLMNGALTLILSDINKLLATS